MNNKNQCVENRQDNNISNNQRNGTDEIPSLTEIDAWSGVAHEKGQSRPPTESIPQAERRFGAVKSTHCEVEGPQSHQEEPIASVVQPMHLSKIPKVQDRIRYRENPAEEWTPAKIISNDGKSTGKNKNYMNILNENSNEMTVIHLDKCEYEIISDDQIRVQGNSHLSHSENNDEEVNITHVPVGDHWRPDVVQAKQNEIENWKKFDVFTEVQDSGQKRISTRWVITEKINENEKIIKAWLVVRGFEEEEQVQCDSPTAAKSTLRTVIAIAANENWDLQTIDIKAAFLQGNNVDRDIFVTPPKEMKEEGVIWKLNKVAYGLNDASRNWYFSVKDELLRLKMKQSKLDNALFRYYRDEHLEGLLLLHVDDFLFSRTKSFNDEVIERLSKRFNVGKRSANSFKYIGLNMNQIENGIYVHQDQYAEELEEIYIPMHRKSEKQSPMTTNEKEKLLTVAGQLNWLATQT